MDQLSQSLNNLELNPVFTLCDSELSFSSAIAFLQSVPSLVIDCEGLNLGVDGGSLSVISIRSQNETFVFDIPSLTCPLDPLFDILMNPGILKILFDGRMDFCALYYRYGIPLTGVIDLQLADIKSRFIRQESLEEHNKRLRRCFSFKQVFDPRNAHKYEPIHVLQGLGACLIEHKCTTTAPKKQVDHDLWLSRPIPPEYLEYAAHDVEIIDALYSHFLQAGYLDLDLPSQSQRYISIWNDHAPKPNDSYRSHPLLPLDILVPNTNTATLLCQGCARHLSVPCFPKTGSALRHCWVCMAVPHWMNMLQIRKDEREKRKAMKKDKEMRSGAATAALFGEGDASAQAASGSTPRRGAPSAIRASASTRGRNPAETTPAAARGRGRGVATPAAPDNSTTPIRGLPRVVTTISETSTRGAHTSNRGRAFATRGRGAAASSVAPDKVMPNPPPVVVPPATRGRGVPRGRGTPRGPESSSRGRGRQARGGRARGTTA